MAPPIEGFTTETATIPLSSFLVASSLAAAGRSASAMFESLPETPDSESWYDDTRRDALIKAVCNALSVYQLENLDTVVKACLAEKSKQANVNRG